MHLIRPDRNSTLIAEIARLHADAIPGLLSLVGTDFLTQMYRYASQDAILIAATDRESLAGFVMGSAKPSRFYRGALLRTWPRLVGALALRPRAIARALSVGRHIAAPQDDAELLSIAVHSAYRGKGVALALLKEFQASLAASGVTKFCVIAATMHDAAVPFYRKTGGVVVAESCLGGLETLVFMYDLNHH